MLEKVSSSLGQGRGPQRRPHPSPVPSPACGRHCPAGPPSSHTTAHSFIGSHCLLQKGGTSRARGWRCWPWANPASLPTTPSPDTPTLACPFFTAGKVLIPSAERWARVCGQERDCLQPPAVLGSSGPAGWPCRDMFILQAHCWPRLLAGPSGGFLVMGTGWRLGGCLCLYLPAPSLPRSYFTVKEAECGAEAQGPPALPEGTAPTTTPLEAAP